MTTDTILKEMGFDKVTNNQYSHIKYGYIHLSEFTFQEVAEKIFELGKYRKCEEIFKVLNIQSQVR